jgi:hypothetical protein
VIVEKAPTITENTRLISDGMPDTFISCSSYPQGPDPVSLNWRR